MTYRFSTFKHKVTVKELANGKWEGTIACPEQRKMFKYRVICNDIYDLRSELHELANNNDAGRAISTKIYDWYYSSHKDEEVM